MIETTVLRLLEAAASWKLGIPGSREGMVAEASGLLGAGRSEPCIVTIASLYSDAKAGEVDQLITQLANELGVGDEFERNLDLLAARRVCRFVIDGDMDERELTAWVHQHFGHQSELDLLDDIAEFDDNWDGAVAGWGTQSVNELRPKVRAAARGILDSDLI